ncbi:MAG: hypothetical protein K8S23_10020 [Candidatus Cloacimonetes bacterium]|nr:hypothetical protein [Candidatus Cloacimonadota bacterium]
MSRPIITINDFIDAVPKKYTWYSYYDDLFVSVIRTNGAKSYIRRKSIYDSKKDKSMSQWHQDWQYQKIENKYGMKKTGIKTYEININNNKNRIDSVVENIAIEFQHTLSVSIEEMELRYISHTKFGYNAILVLDFTDYIFFNYEVSKEILSDKNCDDEFLNIDSQLFVNSLTKKTKKWLKSLYYLNNNLFIDFDDCIVRFSNKLQNGYKKYCKKDFLNNLVSIVNKFKIISGINQIIKKKNYQSEQNVNFRLSKLKDLFNDFYQSDNIHQILSKKIEDEISKLDEYDITFFSNHIINTNIRNKKLVDIISQTLKHRNLQYFFLGNPFSIDKLHSQFYEIVKKDFDNNFYSLNLTSINNIELKNILYAIFSIKRDKVYKFNYPSMAGLLNFIFQNYKQFQHIFDLAIRQYNRLPKYIQIKSFRKKYNNYLIA